MFVSIIISLFTLRYLRKALYGMHPDLKYAGIPNIVLIVNYLTTAVTLNPIIVIIWPSLKFLKYRTR